MIAVNRLTTRNRKTETVHRCERFIQTKEKWARKRFKSGTQHLVSLKGPRRRLFLLTNVASSWTRRDLNPGPLPCEGSDLPLIYEPATTNSPDQYLRLVFPNLVAPAVLGLLLERGLLIGRHGFDIHEQ